MARKRIEAMASINAYLDGTQTLPATDPAAGVPNVQIAPGIQASAPFTELTADQERAFKANRQLQQDQAAQEKELQRTNMEALKQAMANEQAERDAFQQSAGATIGAFRRIGRGAGNGLASIPLPGGLTLPIVILLTFFFLLIPVNGHTRLNWLWLVLTGNAYIGAGQGEQSGNINSSGGDSGSGATNSGGNGGSGSGGGITETLPYMPPTVYLPPGTLSFSGVEEIA